MEQVCTVPDVRAAAIDRHATLSGGAAPPRILTMANEREKVVVAMSGGVDSSVAACLLVEQGYEVIGLFMRVGVQERAMDPSQAGIPPAADGMESRSIGSPRGSATAEPDSNDAGRAHRGCCSASDAADARFVAGMLGIPFYALNFREDFDRIIDYFVDEYVRGRTPNPCVVCNDRLKFGRLLDYADSVGAKYIATGHYARVGLCDRVSRGLQPARTRAVRASARTRTAPEPQGSACARSPQVEESQTPENPRGLKPAARGAGYRVLLRGRDTQKDQSYVLFGLSRAILDRVLFPVGEYTKAEVRDLASRFGLPNRDKPDSVEICFVPDRDYARVVRERRPDAFATGDVVNSAGEVIGQHKGIGHYTIGQRRGLGIAAGKPIYVTELDVLNNTVTVGDADELLSPALVADNANFLLGVSNEPFRAEVKIRYLHTAAPATVYPSGDARVRVIFDEPQRAITPGQAVVFYNGNIVLGGAWINRAERLAETGRDNP